MANPLSLVKALPPSVVSELSRMGIKTTSDLLMHSDISLMHLLNVSMYTARQLLSFVVEHVAPLPVTALQLLRPAGHAQFHIHSPLPALDALLLGSLPPSITEVCGAPGAGKTQFCLSCAAHASVEGSVSDPPFGIVYIDTEGAVDAKRLRELITNCSSMHTKHSVVSVESCLRNIVVKVADDMERLVTFLDELEDIIVSTNVRLIVLDSIASVIRRHFVHGGTYEAIARSDTLARIASTLKRIADTFQIPILVTNQIAPAMNQVESPFTSTQEDSLIPAMGTTWSHAVNTRVFLTRTSASATGTKGKLTITKSPAAPCVDVYYAITRAGVVEASPP